MSNQKKSLAGLSPANILSAASLKQKYRAGQIFEWIAGGAESFDEMSNLPKQLRTELNDNFTVYSSRVLKTHADGDSTVKLLIELSDGLLIESVLLNDENGRKTACISSQAGCAMGCSFCRTGGMGLLRNLTAEEIIEQFLHLKRLYGDIGNIVYMGMGEPLANVDAVSASIDYFTGKPGLEMSPRRLTVSTCGLISGINELAERAPNVRLALSLVTADEAARVKIMPVTRGNGLSGLKAAVADFQKRSGKRVTIECAIIRGINDNAEAAAAIAKWCRGLSVLVNVIPWNPAPEIDFEEPTDKGLAAFCAELDRRRISYARRYRRGRDVNAACGQLATDNTKK